MSAPRRIVDRVVALVALALAKGFYRRLEIDGADELRAHGPRVVVANHFNGFMDVVVLTAAMGRLPRFVAKATLRRIPVVGRLLQAVGVVFVQRRVDGEGTSANVSAFVDCHEALSRGETILIFPEGTTHDREALAPVRTGAARIALGAKAAGVDVVIVPVGLSYGDKTRVRDEVLVAVGPPIVVTDPGPAGEEDHAAVDGLTATITAQLGALTPGVDDPFVAWAFDRAAEYALRRAGGPEPALAARRRLARNLVDSSADVRRRVGRDLANYVLLLNLNGLDDRDVVGPDRRLYARAGMLALATWVLAPFIGWTVLVNAPAIVLVLAVDRFVSVPVTKGTVRALVAVVAFLVTWIVAAVVLFDGWWQVLLAVVAQAVVVLAVAWVLEADVEVLRRLLQRRAADRSRARLPEIRQARDELTEAVAASR